MPINVTCGVCGRKIVNLATSHLCEDGSRVGPKCKGKIGKTLPSMESLILTKEEAVAIKRKVYAATKDLPPKEALVMDEVEFKKERNNPWEGFSKSVFEFPAHPDAVASIKISELQEFKPLTSAHDGKRKGIGYNPITHDHIARSVHCFLKLFRDITLNKTQLDLFNKQLGIKLLGVAPCYQHDERLEDFCNFVITSSKSPYPERAIMVNISPNGGVNFRCLNLTGKGCEVSIQSNAVMLWPKNRRRTDDCDSFKQIVATVVTIFMHDRPDQEDAFNSMFEHWAPLKSLDDNDSFFEFKGHGDEEHE